MLLVCAAYGLFFLYDWVTVRRPQFPASSMLFGAGFLVNLAAVIYLLVDQIPQVSWTPVSIVCAVVAALFGALMLKALFFSLPKGTYASPQQGRTVYRQGMYAICRHPGVLWYALMFCFLALAFATPEAAGACALLIMGNVAYMVFQDLWTFPRTFCDYRDYQATTPFFLPNRASLRAARASLSQAGEVRHGSV